MINIAKTEVRNASERSNLYSLNHAKINAAICIYRVPLILGTKGAGTSEINVHPAATLAISDKDVDLKMLAA